MELPPLTFEELTAGPGTELPTAPEDMTTRDCFAAAAVQGAALYLSHQPAGERERLTREIAAAGYGIADALMARRGRGTPDALAGCAPFLATGCAWADCQETPRVLVAGRWHGHKAPALYCDAHAAEVRNEGAPAYVAVCPSCGCEHGVG